MSTLKKLFAIYFIIFYCFPMSAISIGRDENLVKQLQEARIRLIVMRHAEAVNSIENFIDSNPSPGIYLTDLGEQQGLQAAELLQAEEIDAVYVSPIYRCLQTSQLIAKNLNIPYSKIYVSHKLREQNFGFFNGSNYQEFSALFPGKNEMFTWPVPGGESGFEVFNRSRNLIWKIALNHTNATILIVTQAMNCCHINRSLTGSWGNFTQNCGYIIYDYQNP